MVFCELRLRGTRSARTRDRTADVNRGFEGADASAPQADWLAEDRQAGPATPGPDWPRESRRGFVLGSQLEPRCPPEDESSIGKGNKKE